MLDSAPRLTPPVGSTTGFVQQQQHTTLDMARIYNARQWLTTRIRSPRRRFATHALAKLRTLLNLLKTNRDSDQFDGSTGVEQCRPMFCLHGHEGEVLSTVFSGDGSMLFTVSGDRTARLWKVDSWECMGVLEGHEDKVAGGAFSPNDKMVATASRDCTVRLWDVSSQSCVGVLRGHEALVLSVSFSPNGRLLATAGGENTVCLWNVASQERVANFVGGMFARFSPCGNRVLTLGLDWSACLWGIADADDTPPQCELVLHGHEKCHVKGSFSPDGSMVVTTSFDGTARLWSCMTGRCLFVFEHASSTVYDAQFSTDAMYLVTASEDKTARVWSLTNNVLSCVAVLRAHTDAVYASCFSPDGRVIATAGEDNLIWLWDVPFSRHSQPMKASKRRSIFTKF